MGDTSGGLQDTPDSRFEGAQSLNIQEHLKSKLNSKSTQFVLLDEEPCTFDCIPCQRTFTTSKGLQIHRSYHEKLGNKLKTKKVERQREKQLDYSSSQNNEQLNDLSEFLKLVKKDSNEKQNNPNPLPNHPSIFLQNRVSCECGFIAKNEHGLKIHQNTHKKNTPTNDPINTTSTDQSIPITTQPRSNDIKQSDIELFGILLSKCKEVVPVVRIIQKSVRSSVSQALSKIIDQVIIKNDKNSWFHLLAFPYIVLRSSPKKNSVGPNVIRQNLLEFEKISNIIEYLENLLRSYKTKERTKCTADEQVVKVVNRKLGEGDFSGAMRVLCSKEIIADVNEETFSKLQTKHPTDEIPTVNPDFSEEQLPETTIEMVNKAISSFPISSSAGIDGLRPRHIKDLTSFTCGDAADRLKKSIAKLTDVAKQGKINENLLPIFYSGRLVAFIKENNDTRPIAVGTFWRRITGKIPCYNVKDILSEKLKPHQLGFGARGGAEAIIHAVRSFVNYNHDEPMVLLKFDFKNAFNMLKRQFLLDETKLICPSLLPMLKQAYGRYKNLYYNHEIILSERGVQQGDPLGPPGYCIGTMKLTHSLSSKLNGWFPDDDTIGDNLQSVLVDVRKVLDFCEVSGMSLNSSKCEVHFIKANKDQKTFMLAEISKLLPGVRLTEEVDLLGAPINNSLIQSFIQKKKEIVKTICERLKILDIHQALCLFRFCMSSPKLIYLLRTCPAFLFPNSLLEMDESFRLTLEKICNIKMNSKVWSQASLPFSLAGLGIRKLEDLALPAYLSSIYQSRKLSNRLLEKFNISSIGTEIQNVLQGIPDNLIRETEREREIQKNWDYPKMKLVFEGLLHNAEPKDRARLLASSKSESSKWLQVIPSHELGLLLDNNTIRIAVALRLGGKICEKHICRCGLEVEQNDYHGLSCKKSAGRFPRHTSINKIISKALSKIHFPNLLEPPGISRLDGKRPDGVTIIPWERGKSLLWDATVCDTLAPSYLSMSSRTPSSVADQAERSNHNHYIDLKRNYLFTPISFETLRPMGEETNSFIQKVGKLLKKETGEKRSTSFLLQQISVEIQRGNAASILKTFEKSESDAVNNIFDIL